MSEFFAFLSISSVIGFITFLIVRHIKKKKATPKRLPHRASTSHTNYSSIATVSRPPTSANTVARKPRRADDREYMNYRNCPDCHSENETNRQVIFKLAPHQFVCTVCGNKFNF